MSRWAGLLFLLLCSLASTAALAQLPPGYGDRPGEATRIPPADLDPATLRDMVARLTDAEVRALLLARLDALAGERKEVSQAAGLTQLYESLETDTALVWSNLGGTVASLPQIPGVLADAFRTWLDGRGMGALLYLLAVLAGALAVGYLFERGLRLLFSGPLERLAAAQPEGLLPLLGTLALRLVLDLLGVLAYAVGGTVVILAGLGPRTPDRFTAMAILVVVVVARLGAAVSRFLLAPHRPELRLCQLDDDEARAMHRRLVAAVAVMAGSYIFLQWALRFGTEEVVGGMRLGFLLKIIILAVLVWAIWGSRRAFAAILLGGEESPSPIARFFARSWPGIAIALITIEVAVSEVLIGLGAGGAFTASAAFTMIGVIVAVPFIDTAVKALVRSLYAIGEDEGTGIREARMATRKGLVRLARVLTGIAVFALLLEMLGLDFRTLTEAGLGAQLAGSTIKVLLVILIAYGLWEAVNILASRQLARERASQGETGMPGGDMGGQGGSRLGSVLPILQRTAQVAILVLAILTVLGQFGVNIAPLLAGAGILGLAIGFGAQTLVRDVVSGVFFLVDDAFRIGEYVDIGGTRGTVEKISIRSMRLRHHRGPLHTVPYGEIQKLTNYSRDWVIVKLRFRVPFDTDINRVKRIFKEIGKELLQHPEYGQDFLQPFKSQGVFDVDESGIVVRGKFMTKPGKQFTIRREVYQAVQKKFEEAGIEFARRQVIVQVPGMETAGAEDRRRLEHAAAAAAEAVAAGEEAAEAATDGDSEARDRA